MLVFFTIIKFIFPDCFVFSKQIINECHGQNIELNSVIKLLHIITRIIISSFSWKWHNFNAPCHPESKTTQNKSFQLMYNIIMVVAFEV